VSGEEGWDDDEEVTIPCPYCRRPIHEDSERCPACGNYISTEDAPPSRRPWWIVVGALLALYAVYRWLVM
jgi:predicted amidophosphoribosyltransferase